MRVDLPDKYPFKSPSIGKYSQLVGGAGHVGVEKEVSFDV